MTTATKPTWAKRPDPAKKTAATANIVDDPTDALIRRQTGSELPASVAAKTATKHISMNMNADLHKRLKHYCVKHDTNVSEMLSDLAEKFLYSQPD